MECTEPELLLIFLAKFFKLQVIEIGRCFYVVVNLSFLYLMRDPTLFEGELDWIQFEFQQVRFPNSGPLYYFNKLVR